MRSPFSLTLLLFLGIACPSVQADELTKPTPTFGRAIAAALIPEGKTPPTIDGKLDDEIWTTAPLAEIFYDPQTGKPTSDLTETKLLYDKKFI